MAIIVVGGSNRGVSKTELVCGLIAALPERRWVAVKIAESIAGSVGDENEAWLQTAGLPWESIWEETQPGDDTDAERYLHAGAARSFQLTIADEAGAGPGIQPEEISLRDRNWREGNSPHRSQDANHAVSTGLAAVLDQFWPRFGRGTNFIFESNRVVHHVRPDVCLMIHGLPHRALGLPERHPSFLSAVGHTDAMIIEALAGRHVDGSFTLPGQEPKPVFALGDFNRPTPSMLAWLRPQLGLEVLQPAEALQHR
jgi:hypothetical protein